MQIRMITPNIHITPDLQAFIEKKIGALEHFFKRFEEKGDIMVNLEISRTTKHHEKGDIFYAEATLALPKKVLRGEAYAKDVQMAVNALKNTLKNEIVKYKEQHAPSKIHKRRRVRVTSNE